MTDLKKISLPAEASREETARRIKATRLALDVTPKEIGLRTGIGKAAWSNYENGVSRPNIEDAIRFREVFNISLDWIYTGDLSNVGFDLASKIKEHLHTLS